MKKIILFLIFTFGIICQLQAATLWVNQVGSNTSPYDTKEKGATSAATAIAAMSGGDTLIYADGTYTSDNDRIKGIPSGSDDDHRTVVRAENDFGVILSGMGVGSAPINEDSVIGLYQKEYIDIYGFIIKDCTPDGGTYTSSAVEIYDCDYIRLMRCGVKLSDWSDTAKYGGQVEFAYCSYCLGEDVFVCGDMRYGIIVYGATSSHHNILRRCVARFDYSATTQPRASIVNYGGYPAGVGSPVGASDNNLVQNCIVIDGNDGSGVSENTWTGGFSAPGINSNFTRYGCISLNNAGFGFHWSDFAYSYGCNAIHCVSWDSADSWAVFWYNHLINTGDSTLQYCTGEGGNIRGSTDVSVDYAKDCIVIDGDFVDITEGTGGDTNNDYASIVASGYEYVTRSPDSGKGATIEYKMGTSGTYWGQTGYNTLTGTALWPWPYEDTIRTLFREANTVVTGGAPASNDTERGFCADGETLTNYIWNYLGNGNPYGDSDTTAPSAVSDLAASTGSAEGEIDLTWTAPGDDNVTGTATSYDVRYSTSDITDADSWAAATEATGEPTPNVAGSNESMTVTGLTAGNTYYFAIKTSDEVPNTSSLSNSPSASAQVEITYPSVQGCTSMPSIGG